MATLAAYNPFRRRESHGRKTLIAYRTLTSVSWVLVVVFGIHYSIHRPKDASHGSTVGKQADLNPTPFSQSRVLTGIYWIVLLLSQLGYIGQLWSSNTEKLTAATNVAPYYVLNNLFVLAFILLWVRAKFWGAEVIDIANLISQGILYWKNPNLPTSIHLPAVAGPYAWTISALFWNGAVAVKHDSTIAANIFIWVYFIIGQSHIVHRSDHQLGYSFSVLTLSLALKQLHTKFSTLQWIFSFVVFGLFFASSINSSAMRYFQRSFFFRKIADPEPVDSERQPLLSDSGNTAV